MSADRDRDAVTDRLIEAAMRQAGTGMPTGVSSTACPDPETLAALVERRLASDEIGRLEGHLAGCERCQEVLAALIRALPVLQPVPEPGWSWARWMSSPWRWALPATAAAALLAVWVVSREPVATPTQPETTVAEALPPASGVPPELADERAPGQEESLALRSQAPVPVEERGSAPPAGGVPKAAPEAAGLTAPREAPSPGVVSQPLAGRVLRESAEKAEAPSGGVPRRPAEALDRAQPIDSKRDKGDRPRVVNEAAQVAGAAAAPPAAPAPAAPAAPATAEPPAVMAARGEADAARPADEKAAPDAPLPTKGAQETGHRALAPRTSEIVAADGTARWRFGFGGMLFKSADGMTWERQRTGTTIDLIAGSAPSAAVCWLVGRAGLVLVTTDGERWQRLPFPETIDLVRVAARDARSATVTAVDDRRFETADAGQTWTQRPR